MAYLYMPTCAYQSGPVTVNRNETITCDDETMVEIIRPMLIERGWLNAEQETAESTADSKEMPGAAEPISVRKMKITMLIAG